MIKRKFPPVYLVISALFLLIVIILIVVNANSLGNLLGIYPNSTSETPDFIYSLKQCASLPGYEPSGPFIPSRIVDLDPSIPRDSKGDFLIILTNKQKVDIYFATDSQIDEYLKELNNIDCFFQSFPPDCMTGHYPGEPPGFKTCTVPTQNNTP